MHVWMGENLLDLDSPVVLCEGPLDFCSIWQIYENVACSFTSGISKSKLLRISDADSLITLYDHGKGGDAARSAIKQFMPKYPRVDIIPTKEEDDASNMPQQSLINYLREAGLS
jgi:hypothetical protein